MSPYAGGGPALPETPFDWMDQAACKDVDPAVFFRPQKQAAAKRICGDCPVTKECDAFAGEGAHGVWGGTSPKDRAPAEPVGHGSGGGEEEAPR